MSTFKSRKTQKKKKSGLYTAGVFVVIILAAILLFHIRKIEVTGIQSLTQQEVEAWIKCDKLSNNALYVLAKSRVYPDKPLPMMRNVKISLKNPWTLSVAVKEKKILGGILVDGEYAYFDEEAVVLKKQSDQIPGVPIIEGVEVGKAKIYRKISVENRKLFSYVLQTGELLEKWEIAPDKIVFSGMDVSLYFGELCFQIGDKNFNDRIAQIGPICEKLQGQRGTVHLEKFTDQSSAVSFIPMIQNGEDTEEGEEELLPAEDYETSEEEEYTDENGYDDGSGAYWQEEDTDEETYTDDGENTGYEDYEEY